MAIDKDLLEKLKFLDLRYLSESWDKILGEAKSQAPSYYKFMEEFISIEAAHKKERQRKSRIERANIDEPWIMETFPFIKQPHLKRTFVMELYDSMEYMKNPQGLLFIGPTGCGKSGLSTSFLIRAINQGYRGYFIDFKNLLLILYKSVADHTEKQILKKFQSYDCLVLDQMGSYTIEKEQASLFFEIMKKRHKKKTTMITTQLGFEEWGSFLKNNHLTSALIDQLTENCIVFNMKNCISIRPKKITYGTTED